MDAFVIEGGRPLRGAVTVGGSKNAALPILAAALATDGDVALHNIPDLADVATMQRLLRSLGCQVERADGQTRISHTGDCSQVTAHYDLVRRMRAGICVLGPLLARRGAACVSLPGGCNIGHRPIDLHLRGLEALGAEIQVIQGYVVARASR
jgi:UDP-N-acetylglucosamine 1-carboxyvinyltransferase